MRDNDSMVVGTLNAPRFWIQKSMDYFRGQGYGVIQIDAQDFGLKGDELKHKLMQHAGRRSSAAGKLPN